MGSKEEDVPAAPVEQTRFVEDMNESELATAVSKFKNNMFFDGKLIFFIDYLQISTPTQEKNYI